MGNFKIPPPPMCEKSQWLNLWEIFEKMLKVHTPTPQFYFIRIKQIFMLPFNSNSPYWHTSCWEHFPCQQYPTWQVPHISHTMPIPLQHINANLI
jgi:hypothetical protein